MFGRRTITVNIEHHAFVDLWDKYVNAHPKILIQDAFPMLNNNECVFLITGITPEDWDNIFPKGDKK
jgi:ribosomal protein S17